jgi:Beta xylosidase C-terminal Concanavalin A-like domain
MGNVIEFLLNCRKYNRMKDLNNEAFISLFKEACQKCFQLPLTNTLSETESRHFSNRVFEDTGLVIGAKSIKNYSHYILNDADGKQENPSVSTLDTLARYVLNAPYTDEVQRKATEAHYPYWFQYKGKLSVEAKKEPGKNRPGRKKIILIGVLFIIATIVLVRISRIEPDKNFIDNFHAMQEDSLTEHGWFVKAKDALWWNRRNEEPYHLTLYTLRGDNWPDSANAPLIKNLLLRKISSDCFTTEIHMENFIPKQNWQQAGIILMEDTTFTAKTVRLSIAYNDFFGGYKKPKEIIIQGVSSGGNNFSKPEEIAHIPVLNIEPGQDTLVHANMLYSGLRIEKTGNHFRFLYSTGPMENFAFKEAFSKDLTIKPTYIGIFALQGFVDDTNYIPAHINFFSYISNPCDK